MMKIYAVGGSVRDAMLGLDVKDRDYVVVGATPQQMIDAGYRAVGADFPVFLHPETNEEYALARTERKTAPGYAGFAFHTTPDVTLIDDLKRRDLTINAMAKADDGTLIDPYGGAHDLAQKVLRHVSAAFSEDPVRILRVARFAARFQALGFRVADETLELMRTMVASGEVDHLVPERVWQELARGLMETAPSAMFAMLHASGALAKLLPEVEALFMRTNDDSSTMHLPRMHPSTMQLLDLAAQHNFNLPIRFAVMLHDLLCKTSLAAEGQPTLISLIRAMCERLRVPADCRDFALMVAKWHQQYALAPALTNDDLLAVFDGVDALRRPDRFNDWLLACACIHPDAESASQYLRAAFSRLRSMNQGEIAAKVMPADIPKAIRAAKLATLQAFILDRNLRTTTLQGKT